MRIRYIQGVKVEIIFRGDEMPQALAVLKGLAHFFKAAFIFDVAQELENDLKPKPKLSYTLYHHLCTKCMMEVDTRNNNYICYNDEWYHRECPKLKDKRPE